MALRTTVLIPTAEIRALHTTPKTLVPAPGATQFIQVEQVVLKYTKGAGVFSADESAHLGYSADPAAFPIATQGLALNGYGSDTDLIWTQDSFDKGFAASDINGQPVRLSIAADVTGGTGSLLVITFYNVI